MAGTGITIDATGLKELQQYIDAAMATVAGPRPMMARVGMAIVTATKRRIAAAAYPAKPPHWAYWEGNKEKPLTFKGRLLGSIVHEEPDEFSTRVGSPLKYAASHQFGSEKRSFYVTLIPEYEPGIRKEQRIARFENGMPKGKLVLSTSPRQRAAGETGKTSTRRGIKATIRVLVTQAITARPFLVVGAEERELIFQTCRDYLLRALPGGRAA